MEKKTSGLKNYIITMIIALIIGAMVIIYESGYLPFSLNAARLFCDAFFISGILTLLFGLLAFVANEGGFFAFSYAGKKIKEKFSKGVKEKQSYFDYVQEKRALGKKSVAHMLVVGAALIIISVAILFIFNLM